MIQTKIWETLSQNIWSKKRKYKILENHEKNAAYLWNSGICTDVYAYELICVDILKRSKIDNLKL